MDAEQSYLALFTINHAYTSVFNELVSLCYVNLLIYFLLEIR